MIEFNNDNINDNDNNNHNSNNNNNNNNNLYNNTLTRRGGSAAVKPVVLRHIPLFGVEMENSIFLPERQIVRGRDFMPFDGN